MGSVGHEHYPKQKGFRVDLNSMCYKQYFILMSFLFFCFIIEISETFSLLKSYIQKHVIRMIFWGNRLYMLSVVVVE